jgi:hypothetical protein
MSFSSPQKIFSTGFILSSKAALMANILSNFQLHFPAPTPN